LRRARDGTRGFGKRGAGRGAHVGTREAHGGPFDCSATVRSSGLRRSCRVGVRPTGRGSPVSRSSGALLFV
jgi:hypothetical protein